MRQSLDKVATICLRFILPVSIFLVPLFFLPITPNYFDFNKSYLIYALATLSLVAWTIRLITRRRFQITITPATIPLLGLSIIFILSSVIQSPTPITSLLGKTALLTALTIIFITTTSSQKNETITKLSIISLIAAVLVSSLFTLLNTLELTPGFLPEIFKIKGLSLVGDQHQFLAFSIALIPGMVYLAIKSKSIISKTLLFIACTITLGTIISLINSLVTTGNYVWPFLPIPAGWSVMVDIFKTAKTALLGTGPDNYLPTFTRLRPAYLNLTPVWNVRFTNSSNELLNMVTTTGILAGLFWIFSIIRPIITSSKNKKRSIYHTFALITLITSFIITLIIPVGVTLTFILFTSLVLLCLYQKIETDSVKDFSLNLLATSTKLSQNSDQLPSLPQDKHPLNQLLIIIFALPSIALIIAFWLFAGKAYAAALATQKAILTINSNTIESYNQQVRAYTLDPYNPVYRTNFSQTSFALANSLASQKDLTDEDKNNITQLVQQAIREAKNATALNPQDVTYWNNLANLYRQVLNFAQGSADWAVASYNQAIILDPTNPLLRLDLGGIFFALGDYDQAIKFFGQAVDLKPDWPNSHYNLAAAYSANKNMRKTIEEMRIVVQLLDPNSADYQKAQNELSELEKQVQAATPQTTPKETETPTENQNIELVTPTPVAPTNSPIELPEESAPNIPEPAPTETTPTPQPSATPSPISSPTPSIIP
jgi:tetratricopeptide (TPR) repeat protein